MRLEPDPLDPVGTGLKTGDVNSEVRDMMLPSTRLCVWNPEMVVPPSELRCHGRRLMVQKLSASHASLHRSHSPIAITSNLVRSVQAHKPAKNAAISRASNSGSSAGAKWPPLGIGVHRRTLYRRSAHSRGGVPSSTKLLAKTAMPVGTSTNSCGPRVIRNRLLSLSK